MGQGTQDSGSGVNRAQSSFSAVHPGRPGDESDGTWQRKEVYDDEDFDSLERAVAAGRRRV